MGLSRTAWSLVCVVLISCVVSSRSQSYCRRSLFDNADTEGWTASSGGQISLATTTTSLSGSNIGSSCNPYFQPSVSSPWYFQAPLKFRGTFLSGGSLQYSYLSFQLYLDATSSFVPRALGADVVVTGIDRELYASLPSFPSSSIATGFTRYDFALSQMSVRPAGSNSTALNPASGSDVAAVLEEVQCLKIRGDYFTNPHATYLDNVFFCDTPYTYQIYCPGSWPDVECSGNGQCYSGSCVCNYPWQGAACSVAPDRCASGRFLFPTSTLPTTFDSPPATIFGVISDDPEIGGAPVANATVTLFGSGSVYPLSATVTTDSSGRFQLTQRLLAHLSYYLKSSKRWYIDRETPLPPITSTALLSNVNVVMYLNMRKK